jgi:hypothetical protein
VAKLLQLTQLANKVLVGRRRQNLKRRTSRLVGKLNLVLLQPLKSVRTVAHLLTSLLNVHFQVHATFAARMGTKSLYVERKQRMSGRRQR